MSGTGKRKGRAIARTRATDTGSLAPCRLIPCYRADLSHVSSIIGSGNPDSMRNCAEILRRIIKTVTVGETSSGQIEISITGHLRALIDAPHLSCKAVGGAMVAEERYLSLPPILWGKAIA